MNVSSWLWSWLDAPPQQPSPDLFDHAAKLSLRKLEDRQVLSITSIFSAGLLDIDADAGESVIITVDTMDTSHEVLVNGNEVDTDLMMAGMQALLVGQVTSIDIDAVGNSANNISLAGVTTTEFTALTGGSITVDAGDGADVIVGSEFIDTLNGGLGDDMLDGGLDDDIYQFTGTFGADTVSDSGSVGGDRLDLSAITPVTVNLSAAAGMSTVGDGANTVSFTASQIEFITASSGAGDTFHGLDAASTWTIGATHSYSGGSATITFTGFETLEGGSDSDTFLLNVDSSQTLDGNGGTDTLSYAGHSANISVNLATPTATGLASLSDIENVIGSSGDDTLTGDGFNNVLTGGGGLDTLRGGLGSDTLINGFNSDGEGGTDVINITSAINTGSATAIILSAEIINVSASLTTSNGAITLTGDTMSLGANLDAGTNIVSLLQQTATRAIDLGSETGGSLSLTDTELDRITAGTIVIGDANTGGITFSANIDRGAASTTAIHLTAGSGNNIEFGTFSLDAQNGDVSLTASGSGAITTGDNTGADITADDVILNAGSGGIGSTTNFLRLAAATVTATTSGNGGINLVEDGSVTIAAGGLNAGMGTITLGGGTFTLSDSTSINDEADVNVTGGATLALGTFTETIDQLILTDGSVTGSGAGTLTGTSDFDVRKGSISASLAGAVGLTKTTTNTVILSGANSYSGTTTINGGGLTLSGGSAIVDAGAVVLADVAGVVLTLLNSETIGSLDGGGSTGGNVALGANTLTTGGDATSTAFAGVIGGTGSLIKQGSGTFTLSGTNTYDGGTTISAGILSISSDANLGTAPVSAATNITLNGGTLQATANVALDANRSINLAGAGTLSSRDAGETLTVGGTVNGTQALTLSGAGNITFAGVVGAGVSLASFTQNVGSGLVMFEQDVTVGSGGATFNESVTLDGMTLLSDGAVTFGTASTDTLTISGAAAIIQTTTGSIMLNSTANATQNITLKTGTASGTGSIDINAKLTGSGTILLDAADGITVDAAIDPTTVTLEADDDITISAAVEATNLITVSAGQDGDGSVNLATGGSLKTTAVGSDIVISAGATLGNVLLTGTTTAVDSVTITATGTTSGAINGAGLVMAATVDLNATSGIGNTTALELAGSTITADNSTSGNVNIDNALAGAVTVTTLTTAGGGTILFENFGAGGVSFGTVSTAADASPTAGENNIALSSAGGDLTIATSVSAATEGEVVFTTTGGGNVILMGTTTTDAETVTITSAGSINGAGGMTATTVDLNAATGIGNTTALELAATSISADTTTGAINLDNALATAVSVASLTTGAGSVTFDQSGGGNLTTDTVSASTSVSLTNAAGAIALDGAVTADSLTVTATGTVTDGADGDLAITGNASFSGSTIALGNDVGNSSNFGSLTVTSGGAVNITEGSDTVFAGSSTAGSLTLNTTGTISDGTAGDIGVTGLATLTATTTITLGDSAGNDTNFGSLTFSGTTVSIAEDSNMDLAGSSTGTTVELAATGSINDASASATIITATSLALSATTGIGSGNALETAVTNLAFNNSTSGSVRITNAGALTINSIGTLTTSSNAGTGTTTLIASSPITFAVATSSGGTLTATATESAATNTDNITVNAGVTVESTGGDIVFEAGDRIVISATAIVRAMAAGGNVSFDSGVGVLDSDGAMTLNGTISAGATSGVVTLDLNAQQGATQSVDGKITGNKLRLLSTGASGSISLTSATNDVDILAANTAGAITYVDADALAIGTATTVGITTSDDTVSITTTTGNLTLGDAIDAGAGHVTLSASAGAILDDIADTGTDITGDVVTLTAATGIGATGGGGSLDTAANSLDVSVTSVGLIHLSELNAVTLTDIDTANGSITITSGGAMTATDVESTTNDDANDISLSTTNGGIAVGVVSAGAAGDVMLNSAADITDALAGEAANVIADRVTLSAATGIGTTAAGGDLDLNVAELDASNTTSGNVMLEEAEGVSVLRLANSVVNDNDGSTGQVSLHTVAGTITIAAGQSGVSTIDGNVTLDADGQNSDVEVLAAIGTTSSGSVTITAEDRVHLAAAGDITASGTGGVSVTANTNTSDGDSSDEIRLDDGAVIDAGGGTISLSTAGTNGGDITLGRLVTTSTSASAVTITSNAAVVDVGDADGADIVANSGTVNITAGTAIGSAGDAIDTLVGTLNATANAGGVFIAETDGLTLGIVAATGAGNDVIVSSTTGDIVVQSVTAPDLIQLTALGGGIEEVTVGADAAADLIATTLDLDATAGIGDDATLEITATTITADSSGIGDIDLDSLATATTGHMTATSLTTGTGDITFDQTSTGGPFTLTVTTAQTNTSGNIELTNAGANLTATTVTAGGAGKNVTLTTTTAGDVILAGTITAAGDTVTLTSAGAVTQTGGIVLTASLGVSAVGNANLGAGGNMFDTVAASVSGAGNSLTLVETDGFTVGTVSGVLGLATVDGNIGLAIGGGTVGSGLTIGTGAGQDISVGTGRVAINAAGVTEAVGSIITANELYLAGTGTFALGEQNDIGTVAADITGALMLTDANILTVGTVSATNGITTHGGNATITTGGALTISDDIALGAGRLTLDSAGAVTQGSGDAITAAGLRLLGAGPFMLEEATNDVTTLAANTTGAVAYRDANGLTIGTVTGNVGSTSGITTTNDTVTVCLVTGDLAVSQNVSAGTAAVRLQTLGGGINGGGLVTADTVDLDAVTGIGNTTAVNLAASNITADTTDGNIDLNNALATATLVGTLITGTGNIRFDQTGGGAVTFTTVTTGTGNVTLTADAANLTLGTITAGGSTQDVIVTTTTSGNILVGSVTAADDVTMTSAGAILDNANDSGTDIAGNLVTLTAVTGVGATAGNGSLDTAADQLDVSVTGAGRIHLNEADAVELLAVDTANGSITVTAGGTITATNVTSSATDNNTNDISLTTTSGDILVGLVNAGALNDVELVSAGAIDESGSDLTADVIGGDIRLVAVSGIGHAGKIEINATNLAATTGTGGIGLIDTVGGLTITTIGATVGASITGGTVGDDICLTTLGGNLLTVNSDVTNAGGGDITLAAEGNSATTDLTIAANVAATGGHGSVRLFAGDDLSVTTGTISAAGSGAIRLSAGETNDGVNGAAGHASGDITLADGTLVQATTGDVELEATGNIALSRVITGGDIFVSADDNDFSLANNVGAITDNTAAEGAGNENLTGDDLDLRAATGIGSDTGALGDAGDIDTSATTLNAINTTSGGMQFAETNAVAVKLLSNSGRRVVIDAGGAITDGNGDTASDNVVAQDLVIRAVGGIGGANALDIGVTNLAFANSGSGNVQLTDAGGVTVTSLGGLSASSNTAGAITLTSTGPVTFDANTTGAGTVTVTTTDGAVSNTENITVSAGVMLKSTGGNVVLQAGDRISLAATSTVEATTGSVTLSSGFGDSDNDGSQTLNGLVTAADQITINLNAEAGSATESSTGSLIAADLLLLSTGTGSFSLDASSTNNVATLAAATDGAIAYRDLNALTVGTVGATSGITTTNDDVLLTVLTGGLVVGDAVGTLGADDIALGSGDLTLDVTGAVTQTVGSAITAGGLQLLGTGTVTLNDAANDVTTLATGYNGAIAYTDANALTVGTVTDNAATPTVTTSGLTTSNDNVKLTVLAGGLTIGDGVGTLGADDITLGSGNLLLNVTGNVSQNTGNTIVANGLALMVSGTTTLTEANDVNTLAINNGGAVQFTDADNVTVGSLTVQGMTVTGITTTNDDVKLTTGGNLILGDDINVGTGNLLLNVTGNVSQNAGGTIVANGLALMVSGTTTLNDANDISVLAINNGGAVQFTDIDNLTIGSRTVHGMTVMGITTTSDDVKITTGDNLLVDDDISLGSGNLLLNVTGNVSQNSGDTITADGLALMVSGTTTLTEANDVVLFAANNGGATQFTVANNVTVGSLTVQGMTVTGITTTNDDVKLTTGGNLILGDDINVGTGNLLLNVTGNISQNASDTIVSNGLALMVSGTTTLTEANDISVLAINNGGAVQFTDLDDLTIGSRTVQGMTVTGIATTNDDVKLSTGNNLLVDDDINLGTGNLLLNVTGNVDQNAGDTLVANGLALMVTGATTLTEANDINTLAASTGGTIQFQDADNLTVGSLTVHSLTVTGITTSNDNVTLNAGGAALIDDDIHVGSATLRIQTSTGGISQNAGDTVTAAVLGLRNSDAGNITLNEANGVNTVAIVNSAAGNVSFHDVDDLVIGSVTADGSLFGAISGVVTGDGTHIGGNVLVDAAGLLTVNQPVTTTGGTGGLISVDGSTLNATLTAGAGNITLDGGALDLIINVDQTTNTPLTYTADRDIIIRSTITVNGAASDLILTADNDGDGIGGFWLDEAGSAQNARLTASRDVTITGSDVFATTLASLPVGSLTGIDSVRIDIDGAVTQVQAGRNILVTSQAFAGTPVTADIVIDGVMVATAGSIDANALDRIYLCANQTTGTDILFRDDVQLTSDLLLTAGRDVTFFHKLDDDGVNATGSDLTITAGRDLRFIGAVGGNAGDVLESLTVTDAESIRFQSTVVMNGNIDLTTTLNGGGSAGTVQFDGTVTTTDGGSVEVTNAGKLTIVNNAHFTLDGSFTQNGAAATDLGADISTSGDAVSFLRAVTLTEDAIVIDARTGGASTGNVTFSSTVDSQAAEANSLTINTEAITRFNANVGSTTALKSLTTDAGGTASLNGNVTTTQTQLFNDAVLLTNNVLLTSTGAGASGNVTFISTVNDAAAGTHSLTVNTAGTTRFNSTVGNSGALANLTTDGPGLVSLNGNVTTTGNQTFGDMAVITNNVILTSTASGNITFQDTLNDSAAGIHDLTVNTAGTTRFNATVGNSAALKTITTDGPGTVQLNGHVTTTNAQTYGDDVVLTSSVILDAGTSALSDITFAKSVNTSGHNLTLDAGPLGDLDAVGAIFGGGVLHVIDAATQEYAAITVGSITIDDATTSVTFHGAITTTGSVSVTSGGTITQDSTLNSGNDVTYLATGAILVSNNLTAASDVTLTSTTASIDTDGVITATVGNLTVTAATAFDATAALIAGTDVTVTSVGATTISGAVTAGDDISLTSTSGSIGTTNTLNATDDITITAATTFHATHTITAGDSVHITTTNGTTLTATADVCAGAGGVLVEGVLATATDILTTSGPITFNAAVTLTGDVLIDSDRFNVGPGANITFNGTVSTGGNDLTLDAGTGGNIDANGAISGGGAMVVEQGNNQNYVAITVDSLTIQSATTSVTFEGPVTTTGNVSVTSSGTITQQTTLVSGNDVTYAATGAILVSGNLTAASDVTLTSTLGSITTNAPVAATSGNVSLDAKTTLTATKSITAGTDVTLTSGGNTSLSDPVTATAGDVTATAGGTFTSTDTLTAGDDIAVTAVGNLSSSGTVLAGSDVTFVSTAGSITTNADVTATAGNIVLTAATSITSTQALLAGTDITLTGGGAVVVSDTLTAGDAVTVTSTGSLIAISAAVDAADDVTLSSATSTSLTATVDAGDDFSITAGTTINATRALTAGSDIALVSGTNTTLSDPVTATLGNITANVGGAFTATDTLTAGTDILVTSVGNLSTSANVTAGRDVSLVSTAADIDITAPVDAGRNVNLNAATNIDASATLHANNGMTITSGGVTTLTAVADITTGASGVTMVVGQLTTAADITTGLGAVPGSGAISITGPVVLTNSITWKTDASGSGANVTVTGTIDGTADQAQDLTLTTGSGDLSVTGNVGATTKLGDVLITQADDTTFGGSFAAESFQQLTGDVTTFFGAVVTCGTVGVAGTDGFQFTGNSLQFAGGSSSLDTRGQDITITTDALTLPTTFVNATGKTVTIKTLSDATSIGLNDATQDMHFTDTQLDVIHSDNIVIGQATNTGGIKIGADGAVTQDENYTLLTATSIQVNGRFALDATHTLTATIGQDLDVTGGGRIETDAGDMALNVGRDLTMAGLVATTSGNMNVTVGEDADISGNIESDSGNVTLTVANAMSLSGSMTTNSGDLTADVGANLTTTATALVQSTSGSIDVTVANDASLAGDIVTGSGSLTMTVGRDLTTAATGLLQSDTAAVNVAVGRDATLAGDVTTASGSFTLIAGDDTALAASVLIRSISGDVTLTTGTACVGAFTMSDGAVINAGSGRVTITSERDITIGRIVTTNGTASAIQLTSNAGAILDGGDATGENLVAETAGSIVTLRAVTGIGSATGSGGDADLETSIRELVAVLAPDVDCGLAASGDIQIDETNTLNIRGLDQQGSGVISVIADGTIVVTAATAGGTGVHARAGSILLSAELNTSDLDIRHTVETTGGAITLKADNDVILGQVGNGTTGQVLSRGGNIVVLADDDANADAGTGGELFMRDGSVISATRNATTGGTIELRADENITLGTVTTTNNTASALRLISRSAGLVDGGDLGLYDLEANSTGAITTIQTATGIGSDRGFGADAHLETRLYEVNIVNGAAVAPALRFGAAAFAPAVTSNDIFIKEADGLRIQQIDQNNAGVVTVSATGDINLLAGFGGVTSTSGDVMLTALGINADVVIDSQLTTTGGNVTVNADHDVRMGSVARVASSGGIIHMTAGADGTVSNNQGEFFMANGAVIDGAGGEIRLTADQAVTLGHVVSHNDCNTLVAITSQRGSILDGGSSGVTDVTAGTLVLRAATGVGTSNALELDVCKLAIINAGSGNIEINSISGELLEIVSADGVSGITNSGPGRGDINLTNNGTVLVNADITNRSGGDINVTTTGAGSDIDVHAHVVDENGGSVRLMSAHDIHLFDAGVTAEVRVEGGGIIILDAGHDVKFEAKVMVQSGTGSITDVTPYIFNVETPQITALGEAVIKGNFGRPGEHNFAITVDWGDGTIETYYFDQPGAFEFHHTYQGNPNAADPSAPIEIKLVIQQDPDAPQKPGIAHNPNTLRAPNIQVAEATITRNVTPAASKAGTPGEGLAAFVFDVTPPVVLLTLPEAAKFLDVLQQSGVQLAEGSSIRIEASGLEAGVAAERLVNLEILSPDGSVRERVSLSESVLDDMLDVIGKLPDGKYRFQLQEPGEERQRTLLEFEVRQGKIADAQDAGDRPPTSTKTQVVDDAPADAEKVINSSGGDGAAQLVLPPAEKRNAGDRDEVGGLKAQLSSVEQESRSLWNGWSSVAARRAWTRGGRVAEDLSGWNSPLTSEMVEAEETAVRGEPSGETIVSATGGEGPSVAGGSILMVGAAMALVGATAAATDLRQTVQQASARLSRAARLFRKYSDSQK